MKICGFLDTHNEKCSTMINPRSNSLLQPNSGIIRKFKQHTSRKRKLNVNEILQEMRINSCFQLRHLYKKPKINFIQEDRMNVVTREDSENSIRQMLGFLLFINFNFEDFLTKYMSICLLQKIISLKLPVNNILKLPSCHNLLITNCDLKEKGRFLTNCSQQNQISQNNARTEQIIPAIMDSSSGQISIKSKEIKLHNCSVVIKRCDYDKQLSRFFPMKRKRNINVRRNYSLKNSVKASKLKNSEEMKSQSNLFRPIKRFKSLKTPDPLHGLQPCFVALERLNLQKLIKKCCVKLERIPEKALEEIGSKSSEENLCDVPRQVFGNPNFRGVVYKKQFVKYDISFHRSLYIDYPNSDNEDEIVPYCKSST